MYKDNHTIGYSLVEVLVAISVLLLSIVGPLTIASRSLQASFFAREQAVATFLAQEGIEAIFHLRNNEVLSALSSTPMTAPAWTWQRIPNILSNCYFDGCRVDISDNGVVSFSPCDSSCAVMIDGKEYTRRINLIQVDTDGDNVDAVVITSQVSWNSGLFVGSDREVVLTSVVHNVYEDVLNP